MRLCDNLCQHCGFPPAVTARHVDLCGGELGRDPRWLQRAHTLYRLYQEAWAISPLVPHHHLFGLCDLLLLSLLTVGHFPDGIGRRPVISVALLRSAACMGLFIEAHRQAGSSPPARCQDCASLTSTLRHRARHQPHEGPLINSITPFLGMALGALVTSGLVAMARTRCSSSTSSCWCCSWHWPC